MIKILFSLIALVGILSSCSTEPGGGVFSGSTEKTGATLNQEKTNLTQNEQVRQSKQRRMYIDEIRKADYFALKNESDEAINRYIAILEKLPDDNTLLKKIAHIFFEKKEWAKSYDYYKKVATAALKEKELEEFILSVLWDESTSVDVRSFLESMPIDTEKIDYYKMIDTCHSGIHNCIITILAYSGTGTALFVPLQQTINSYDTVSPDFHYRNMLVATKLFGQGMYRASFVIAEEVLKNRPDYKEAWKILGFSAMKLGKYERAKTALTGYLEIFPKDIDTIVALGEIHFKLGDYVLSNLYLNNAILTDYEPKISLERRLAYNYLMLDDTVSMLKVMNYLLQRPEAKEDDFIIGVITAKAVGETVRAFSWANEGLKKFPESLPLITQRASTLRMLGKYADGLEDIERVLSVLPDNTDALVEKGMILYDQGEVETARELLIKIEPTLQNLKQIEEVDGYLARPIISQSGTELTQP